MRSGPNLIGFTAYEVVAMLVNHETERPIVMCSADEVLKLKERVRIAIQHSALSRPINERLTNELACCTLIVRLEYGDRPYRGKFNRRTREITLIDHVPVVLLHELVHRIGGNEMDAETIEHVVFPETATTPDRIYDAPRLLKGRFRGRYVQLTHTGIVCRQTGKVLLSGQRLRRFLGNLLI